MKYALKIDVHFPGIHNYAPMNRNDEYVLGKRNGYTVEYLPKFKTLQYTIPNCFGSSMMTHKIILNLFDKLSKTFRLYKVRGNEYIMQSFVADWFAHYNKEIAKARGLDLYFNGLKKAFAEYITDWDTCKENKNSVYDHMHVYRAENKSGTCAFAVYYVPIEAENDVEQAWLDQTI